MKKILFIDRDGTLINEPQDYQVDNLEKLALLPHVIPALLALKSAGYTFVMVTNQDGLGTESFTQTQFQVPHDAMMALFSSQGIAFEEVLICPHTEQDGCECRKPKLGLVMNYCADPHWDRQRSYMIGDRETDVILAERMNVTGIRIDPAQKIGWNEIADSILKQPRLGECARRSNETDVSVTVNLDQPGSCQVSTGIGFFDHMLEQLAKHGNFSLDLSVQGDLHVDEHHSVEDCALVLGAALRQALGDKLGITRYGFLLPMDEAAAQVALDLSGRPYWVFNGKFSSQACGALSTEMVIHFFQSFTQALGAALHISVTGENTHHMVEAMFKGVGRCLGQAVRQEGNELPSTKGLL